ncbi:unnamed protein product [Urochloa humidicola]
MQSGGVVELAREAAASVRAEQRRAAAPVAPAPWLKYRGVQKRGRRFAATLWNPYVKKAVWLGSYATPVEAAYAYDAAARTVLGRWARPNFPDPSSAPAQAGSQAPEPAAAARNRQQQQPAARHQPQGPAIHLAPAPAAAAAPAIPLHRAASPPILRLFYRPGIGLFAVPFVPGGHVLAVPNQHPVSMAVSSTAPADGASQSGSAVAGEPERRDRELSASPAMVTVEPVVGDNFTGIDGASSSAARA